MLNASTTASQTTTVADPATTVREWSRPSLFQHSTNVITILFATLLINPPAITAQIDHLTTSTWRAATEAELKEVIPPRAPVEKERIETESRTASGITDGKGRYVAGVVLITAGYSANGKYSHFFFTQAPLRAGSLSLKPGEYVFGWSRNEDSLTVTFYEAQSGKPLGTVEATRNSRIGRIESFHIYPPAEKPIIQIGRFGFTYKIGG